MSLEDVLKENTEAIKELTKMLSGAEISKGDDDNVNEEKPAKKTKKNQPKPKAEEAETVDYEKVKEKTLAFVEAKAENDEDGRAAVLEVLQKFG